ncbi:MAG: hypothetical protein SFW36_09685 [Leptolyngbyaceae cyanobacterium bins.59]|nr:hypothetical protein [Leptolyngbyaceae cyanobacterium bins.59]
MRFDRILRFFVTLTLLGVGLSACTPSGDAVASTSCNTALALATYTWQVEYFTSRGNPQGTRIKEFANTRLLNQNGKKPTDAVTGPDDKGVWWPALPPRPSADAMDAERQPGELYEPPRLQQTVRYTLQCTDGELGTDDATYRQAARTIRAGQSVEVNYTLGRVLNLKQAQP